MYSILYSSSLDNPRPWKRARKSEKQDLSQGTLVLHTLSFQECVYYMNFLSALDTKHDNPLLHSVKDEVFEIESPS
jgi:hypothetical protein